MLSGILKRDRRLARTPGLSNIAALREFALMKRIAKNVLVGSLAQCEQWNVQLMQFERLLPSNSGSFSVVARCFDTRSFKFVSVDTKSL